MAASETAPALHLHAMRPFGLDPGCQIHTPCAGDQNAAGGERINTLLARKHYAVRALRARLQEVYDDWITDEGASNG